MYDADNPLVKGKNPTIRFDNKNTLITNRLRLVQTEAVIGDVNADGTFNTADLISLQKWLLVVPDTHLADWKAADLNGDNQLNAVDLSLLKRLYIRAS